MIKEKEQAVLDYLNELIPNPVCELHYEKDYELLLAVMLSAQTTDKRVNQVTDVLFKRYPTLKALSEASLEEVMEIIRPIGTYHKKASNVIAIATALEPMTEFPRDRAFLESLPGVGRKTTNVVLSTLFDEPCIAVDTHVSRVSIRLGFASPGDDVRVIEEKLTKRFRSYNLNRLHHQLILFGRYYCKAVHPLCDTCKLKDLCQRGKKGIK